MEIFSKIKFSKSEIGSSIACSGTCLTIEKFKGNIKLCSELQCPLKKGNMNFNTSFEIPEKFPHGKFKIQVIGIDQDNQELFCVKIDFIIDKNGYPVEPYTKNNF